MAKAITEIMGMSAKGQEYVLSRFSEEYSPLEINGVLYMIPDAVNDLIGELILNNKDSKVSEEV